MPLTRRLAALQISTFLLLLLASVAPIQSYDAFWHLATGRWILEHRALPATDPFGLASDSIPWHNGEWLFQIAIRLIEQAAGVPALSVARALAVALLFVWLFGRARSRSSTWGAAALVAIAYAGADHRLGVRPEIAGVVLATVVLSILLERVDWKRLAVLALLTALWINLHPSALLAPLLATAVAAGRVWAGERERPAILLRLASIAVTALALVANPYGFEGVAAPVRLASVVSGTAFVNVEWLPSRLADFPLLYAAILAGAALFAMRRDRRLAAEVLVFLIFAVLAIRFVRNQGYFFASLPLLLAPALPRLESRAVRGAALAAAALVVITAGAARGIGVGADASIFPVRAVAQLESSGLRGNVYNPDQFGGYLIWRMYPERRVLTDGRNELYLGLLRELPRAFEDSRAWKRLFERYELVLAVEEYRPGTVRVVDRRTNTVSELPRARVYFPPSEWALIGFDDVAMVFAKRDRWPREVLDRLEYRTLDPSVPAIDPGAGAGGVGVELQRAADAGAWGWRLERMMRMGEELGGRGIN